MATDNLVLSFYKSICLLSNDSKKAVISELLCIALAYIHCKKQKG